MSSSPQHNKPPSASLSRRPHIVVVNKRRHKEGSPGFYIGRGNRHTKGSALGNPFKMKQESDRDHVVELYDKWLTEEIKNENSPARKELFRLVRIAKNANTEEEDNKNNSTGGRPLNLVCWCAPKRCHGDVVKAKIEELFFICPPAATAPAAGNNNIHAKQEAENKKSGTTPAALSRKNNTNGVYPTNPPGSSPPVNKNKQTKKQKQPKNKTQKEQQGLKIQQHKQQQQQSNNSKPKKAINLVDGGGPKEINSATESPPPAAATTANKEVDLAAMKKKQERKLRKKLREIEQLKSSFDSSSGESSEPNADQQSKIDSEVSIRQELQQLMNNNG